MEKLGSTRYPTSKCRSEKKKNCVIGFWVMNILPRGLTEESLITDSLLKIAIPKFLVPVTDLSVTGARNL